MKLKSNLYFYSIAFCLLIFSETIKAQTLPMFRGSISHTGIFDSCDIQNPTIKWRYRTNGQIFSSPVVNNEVLYIGSNDNKLYALNANDGSLIWTFETRGRIKCTPLVDNNTVYFGSFDSTFYALDTKTGKEKWRFQMRCESYHKAKDLFGLYSGNSIIPDPWDFYFSSPVVLNDKICFGSGDSSIYCLNKINGTKIWEFKTKGVVHSSPAISEGILYCGSWDSKMYAIDIETGSLIWDFQAGTDTLYNCFVGFQASPVIAEGVLYCGSRDAAMYALDAKTGTLIWKTYDPGMSWFPSSCSVKGEYLYCGSSDGQKFYVINRNSGYIDSFIYTYSYTFSSPAVSGNTAFIGAANGWLYSFDLESNTTNWIFKTDASQTSLFITPEGKANDHFYSDIYDYGTAWEIVKQVERIVSSNGSILSSPFIYNNTLYFAGTDGYIYALQNGLNKVKSIQKSTNKENLFSVYKTLGGWKLNYSIINSSQVKIRIAEYKNGKYNLVKEIFTGQKEQGQFTEFWNGKDNDSKTVCFPIF